MLSKYIFSIAELEWVVWGGFNVISEMSFSSQSLALVVTTEPVNLTQETEHKKEHKITNTVEVALVNKHEKQ